MNTALSPLSTRSEARIRALGDWFHNLDLERHPDRAAIISSAITPAVNWQRFAQRHSRPI